MLMRNFSAVLCLLLIFACQVAYPEGVLPELSATEITSLVKTSEDAVRSLYVHGSRQWVRRTLSKKGICPDLEEFKSTELVQNMEWAFLSNPYSGKLYHRSLGTSPWEEGLHPTAFAEKRRAFNGEYATSLTAQQIYDKSGPRSDPAGNPEFDKYGRIAVSSSPAKYSPVTLRGHTLWMYEKSFSQCLKDKDAIFSGSEVVNGLPLYKIEFPPRGRITLRHVVFLDPSRGFSIAHQRWIRPDTGETEWETMSVELAEVKPGVWYPEVVVLRQGDTDYTRYVIEKVQINDDLPDSLFTVQFPNGTYIRDERTGAGYVVGLDSAEMDKIVGEIVKQAVVDIQKGPATSEERRKADIPTGAREKPAYRGKEKNSYEPSLQNLLLVTIAALVVGISIGIVIRRRR